MPPRPGLLEMSQYLQDHLARMQKQVDLRAAATPADLPAIDAEMGRICQDLADGVGSPFEERDLSGRLRRMRDLTLEELRKLALRA